MRTIFFFCLFWGTMASAIGAQTESATALDSLKSIRQQLASLQETQLLYLHKIDSLSAEIDRLKQDDYQTYFKRRRLESMLRQFHEINAELIRVETELQTKKDQENRWLQLAFKNQEDWRPQSVPAVKRKRSAAVADSMVDLDEKYQELINRLRPGASDKNESGVRIRLDANDTPRQIIRKADILRDREDKLRVHAKLIREKINQAQGNTELRQRLGDLLDDISLFDHRDEPVSPQRQSTRDSKIAVTDLANTGSGTQAAQSPELLPIDELMKVDFKELSANDAEEVVRKLEELLQQVEKMANSLAIEAERFYHAAKIRRDEK